MKTMNELVRYADSVLNEAKKKKEKAEELKYEAKPDAYSYAEAFDFSAPLGAYNLYKSQGAVNWGPMTGPGTKVDDHAGTAVSAQKVKKYLVGEIKDSWTQAIELIDGKRRSG